MLHLPPFVRRLLIRLMRRKNRRPANGQPTKKICIFKHDRLGDFILAIGAIRFLQNLYGEKECTLVVSELVADFAQSVFPNSDIVVLPFVGNNLLRGVIPTLVRKRRVLRSLSFDKIVCLRHQRTIFHELVLSRIATKKSYGVTNITQCLISDDHDIYEFPLDAACDYPSQASPDCSRELEANRRVLSMAIDRDIECHEIIPSLDFPPATEGEYILVSPFGSSANRSYPNPLLIEAMRMIEQQDESRFLLCAAPSDTEKLHELFTLAIKEGIKNVEIKQSPTFADFCSLVAAARGVLAVETSTAHLATALDKPTVVLVGGGQIGDFGPWHRSNKQAWLTHPMPCMHCNWQCMHRETFCISRIEPEEIARALTERMQSNISQ